MRTGILAALAIVVLVVTGVVGANTAVANPTGLFVNNESCVNGLVEAQLNWTPDSAGQQYVDISARNDNFSSAYSTAGPFPSSRTREPLERLQPNTTYYLRVSTLIGTEFLRSATLSYRTRSCAGGGSSGGGSSTGSATPPLHLQGAAFSPTQARFQWIPGMDNRFFCLDYAKSLSDLINGFGTWRNTGCGTTSNSVVVSNLSCGTNYFARVWTPAGGGLYSSVATIQTSSCASAISPPTNLRIVFATKTTARIDWEPGKDNRWFCIDTARNQQDLLEYEDTWRNHSCWTTNTQETIRGLSCGDLYFYRIYTWNPITSAHSGIGTFRTDNCNTSLVEAPIEDIDVDKVGNEYHAEITVGKPNSCHSFGGYEADTFGNVIELTIYNTVAPGACAEVYSTYTLTINLGSGYFSGTTYVVVVNDDESDTFTAN